jgi:Arc/MetJ-type ribon-helix-helix transcriptional regulator
MKNVSISLTDTHAAAIEAELATGDYASVSEIVRAALRDFFDERHAPDRARIDADVAAYRAARARGEPLLSRDEARRRIAALVDGEPSA